MENTKTYVFPEGGSNNTEGMLLGSMMRRWYATMVASGVSIPWEEFNE